MHQWIAIPRTVNLELENSNTYTRKCFIRENFEKTEKDLPGMKLPPLEHQRCTIQAMMDLERIGKVTITNGVKSYVAETCAGVLSEKPGSGKSYVILATITNNNITKRRLHTNSVIDEIHSPFQHSEAKLQNCPYIASNVITQYKHYLPLNLIFVAKSVVDQWGDYIERYTSHKVFTVNGFAALEKFTDILQNNRKKLKEYKIILVKDDIVSAKLNKLDHPYFKTFNESKSMLIIDVMSILFKDIIVDRVILDDFDTLKKSENSGIIPAFFTWFISATKQIPKIRHRKKQEQKTSIKDYLLNYQVSYNEIWHNPILFTYFNIGCDNAFIDNSTSMSVIEYYKYKFQGDYHMIRNAIAELNKEISEYVNGDSYNSLRNKLKLKDSAGIIDIFEHIYAGEYRDYSKHLLLRRNMLKMREHLCALNESKKYSEKTLTEITAIIKKGNLVKFTEEVTHYDENIKKIIKVSMDETTRTIESKKIKINRVIDNFRVGECPITMESLQDQVIVALKCCGIVISSEGLSILQKTTNVTCPKCRTPILKDNIIVMDKEMAGAITELDDDAVDISEEESDEVTVTSKDELDELDLLDLLDGKISIGTNFNTSEVENLPTTKENAVLKLILLENPGITGEKFNHCVSESIKNNKGFLPLQKRKYLIFCKTRDSINNIINNGFQKYGIRFGILGGKRQQITKIVEEYHLPAESNSAVNVLFINSGSKAYAGLDLQNTTDIIFLHKIQNIHIETQMIGRASRIGRTSNLRVHWLLYENEY